VFLVNVAPCAPAIAFALRLLPADRGRTASVRLDVAGAVSATAGLALIVLGLTRAEQAGPEHPTAWGALALGAALLVAFARIERRAPDPLLPPGTLRRPRLAAGLLASLAITTASTGSLFLCVLHLQHEQGLPATETGLLFAPFNLAVIAGSVAGARLGGVAGLLAIAAGAAGLLALPGAGPAVALPAFLVMGLGVGCAAVAATAAGTDGAEPERQGLASGLLNTGLSAFVLLAEAVPGAGATGFRVACAAAAATAAAGALAFGALKRRG
jgi:Major Facilitator Superfamily